MRKVQGKSGHVSSRGFTLLEVMVALAIAALALAAISSSHSSSVIHSVKVYRMTTAAMLLKGVVLDIEEEYQVEGFRPTTWRAEIVIFQSHLIETLNVSTTWLEWNSVRGSYPHLLRGRSVDQVWWR